MKTILDALGEWSKSQPNKKVWSFLNDKGIINDEYTYKELEDASSALAVNLIQTHKLNKGDRILLVFFPGLDFTVSLLACFKCGLIAVPVFPPDPRRLKKDLDHFVNIQISSGAQIVLTNSQYNFVKKIENLRSIFVSEAKKWPDLQWIQVDDTLKRGKAKTPSLAALESVVIDLSDVAFLQYTSGSTSDPKGVMISHLNLAHNLSIIIKELEADTSTVVVSWLPQYHDMGLIGSYLGIVFCGGSGNYLSPISFLKDPVVWVRAISMYKGTHTQAPNFAFALVARKYKESISSSSSNSNQPKMDLSSMRHMINAAEPVDYQALRDFYATFGPLGLQRGVVFPTYGLAEHTVFVCSGGTQILTVTKASLESGDSIRIVAEDTISSLLLSGSAAEETPDIDAELSLKIVGCGYPGRNQDVDVRIVHGVSNQPLGEDSVGEVWMDSPSKALGYWQQHELTAHDFHAKYTPAFGAQKADGTTDADDVRTYLRTGDLGFMHKNELFICGRLKDLIIVRGANHYPQDIERTAEQSHSAFRAGCSAAFAFSQGGHTEAVVYVAELKDNIDPLQYSNIVSTCRERISKEHGLSLHCVVLLRTRSIPKTTSGKIARSWCRKAFLEGTLNTIYRWDGDVSTLDTPVVETGGDEGDLAEGGAAGEEISHQGKKYTPVAGGEQNSLSTAPLAVEQVRAMPLGDLVRSLELILLQISSQGPTQLSSPVDPDSPLVSLGLDSMTVVQFKGVLENRYYCENIPDEFLFTPLATLKELAVAVREGTLTSEQRRRFDAGAAAGGDPASTTVMIQPSRKQPCCPWFTCCY